MSGYSFDISLATMFDSRYIAITHQGQLTVFTTNHPMNHVARAIDPCQHHITDLRRRRAL